MMITDPFQIELLRHSTLMSAMGLELTTGMKMSRGANPFDIAARDGYCSPRARWTKAAKREALVEMHSMRLANDPAYTVMPSVATALGL